MKNKKVDFLYVPHSVFYHIANLLEIDCSGDVGSHFDIAGFMDYLKEDFGEEKFKAASIVKVIRYLDKKKISIEQLCAI